MNHSGLVHSFKKSGLIESYTSTFIFQVKKGQAAKFSDVESTASSQSELVLMAQEQYLTTILERTETNTLETLERIRRAEVKYFENLKFLIKFTNNGILLPQLF